MVKKTEINLEFTSNSNELRPLDLAREIKNKNLRFEKTKTLANQGVEDIWTDSRNAQAPAQHIVIEDTRALGGSSAQSSLVDWAGWLPFAAKQYNISPDVKDYVVIPVPTIITDLPNRNGIAFPLREMVMFRPQLGMQSYRTWKGKPTFEEHVHDDHTKAKGVILDTHMRKIPGMNVWRLMKLLAFDRTRDPQLCNDILARKRNSYSMGAYLDGYTCSICHKEFGSCTHPPTGSKKGDVIFLPQGDSIVFLNVVNPEGFETSAVKTPAFIPALNDNVIDMNQLIGEDVDQSHIIQMANVSSTWKFANQRG